ncbi:putative zinc-type alcohol dehydrogenase-like protein [Leptodontidium sp. MPI-SDFR-AT-0119]|nr:putative zinc-type alcohol dehydrogenase-like protein [Leptodontidium sp. MPI-SDFR-AT-0119]
MSQNALLLRGVGTPLVLGSRPIPKPGPNQLLVKVIVTSLNPHDQKTRDVGLFVTQFPYVLASELVGEIVDIGEGEYSAEFAIGDHVFGHTVANTGLTDDEAAIIPVVVLAGFIALFSESGLGLPPLFSPKAASFDFAAATLLVIGGGSNTGKATVELGKMAGFGRIVVVTGLHNEVELKARGATHLVDRHAADVLERVRTITGDDLIYAIDTVNAGQEQELGVAALSNSKRGTLITQRRGDEEFGPDRIGNKVVGYERRAVLGVSLMHPEVTVGFWKQLPAWLKDGKIHPSKYTVVKGLDAEAVNNALDGYLAGKAVKTNIHP